MKLLFITGNKNKFSEVSAMLHPIEVEQVDIDLDEIQELDAQKVIEHKLRQAQEKMRDSNHLISRSDRDPFLLDEGGELQDAGIVIEDTSLYFDCLEGKLPGPFIKWFLNTLEPVGLAEMVNKMGNNKARAVSLFGYLSPEGNVHFFDGETKGSIVAPKGDKDFGWGPIFVPEGSEKTFGEMEREEKHEVSMRGIAAQKLKQYLMSNP